MEAAQAAASATRQVGGKKKQHDHQLHRKLRKAGGRVLPGKQEHQDGRAGERPQREFKGFPRSVELVAGNSLFFPHLASRTRVFSPSRPPRRNQSACFSCAGNIVTKNHCVAPPRMSSCSSSSAIHGRCISRKRRMKPWPGSGGGWGGVITAVVMLVDMCILLSCRQCVAIRNIIYTTTLPL